VVTLVACDWEAVCGAGNCKGRNVFRMECGDDERRGDGPGGVAKRGWVRVRVRSTGMEGPAPPPTARPCLTFRCTNFSSINLIIYTTRYTRDFDEKCVHPKHKQSPPAPRPPYIPPPRSLPNREDLRETTTRSRVAHVRQKSKERTGPGALTALVVTRMGAPGGVFGEPRRFFASVRCGVT
jgi:hypothetical protein